MIGLGFKGDIVTVSKRLARNHMLPASVAEYVTEENLKKYEHIRQVVNNTSCDCSSAVSAFGLTSLYSIAQALQFPGIK